MVYIWVIDFRIFKLIWILIIEWLIFVFLLEKSVYCLKVNLNKKF